MNNQVFCDLVTANDNWRPWNNEKQYQRTTVTFDTFEQARAHALRQLEHTLAELNIKLGGYEIEQWETDSTYFVGIYNGPRMVIQYEIYPYNGEEYDDLPW